MEKTLINRLYNPEDLDTMILAEQALGKGLGRVQEIKKFAVNAGIKKIGIAHCVAVTKEAELVKQFLAKDFEVHIVDCKCGRITKQEMLGVGGDAIVCNPAGQAAYLSENNTELNISMGLCVGHDMVFNKQSDVMVTVLLVKDRVHKHNPLETIKALGEEQI